MILHLSWRVWRDVCDIGIWRFLYNYRMLGILIVWDHDYYIESWDIDQFEQYIPTIRPIIKLFCLKRDVCDMRMGNVAVS